MANEVPERGRLTDMVITYLTTELGRVAPGVLVGDGDPPAGSGWSGAQPGVGDFTASVTVRTAPAQPLHRETIRSRHQSWRCGYSLRTVGALRSHADAFADLTRSLMVDLREVDVTGVATWKIQDAVYESLGGVDKRGSGDNATWEVDDVLHLWVVRSAT